MQIEERGVMRRRLISWMGVLSVFTIAGAALMPWKNKKPKTVKMLTEDGKLVEVDVTQLSSHKRRISDKELQSWVKNK